MDESQRLSIRNWDVDDRPRERLMKLGAQALSNSELLAILIGSGNATVSAVELMKRILSDHDNSLEDVGRLSIDELCQYNGIGPAKAVTIAAACELGRRRQSETSRDFVRISSGLDIFRHLYPIYQDLVTEEVWLLLMRGTRLMRSKMIFRGGLDSSTFDLKVILKEALMSGANIIAVAHNHPSGEAKPSRKDDEVTSDLYDVCQKLDLTLLDHVIVAGRSYYSYRENGFID